MTTFQFLSEFKKLDSILLSIAAKLTRNTEEAKDLVQETAYKAFGNKEKYHLDTNFRAWVLTIMRNIFINQYRRKKRVSPATEPIDDYLFAVESRGVRNDGESRMAMAEMNGMIKSLGSTFSVPFSLHCDGYKYDEIAQELDIPVGTVKSRIFFARKKLRNQLTEMSVI